MGPRLAAQGTLTRSAGDLDSRRHRFELRSHDDKEVAWNVGDGVCDHVGDNRCILLGAMVVIEMMMGEEDDKVVKVVFKEFGKRKEHFL